MELDLSETIVSNATTQLAIVDHDLDELALYRVCLMSALGLILIYILSGHLIEIFRFKLIHESTVGVLTGILVQYFIKEKIIIEFQTDDFFFFLLPPIVFASAYTLRKKNFIRNISYVFGLGILGTIVAMIVISVVLFYGNEQLRDPVTNEKMLSDGEVLLIASVFASTDTVAVLTLITPDKYEVLNAVLFGEGVVNDAVTILLYNSVETQLK